VEYPSNQYLEELKHQLVVFIPSTAQDSIKPKRELAIKKAYDGVYDIQCAGSSIINDISISHLLAINEVVVPHLVEEYAKLNFVLKTLESKLKGLNQFSELSDAVSDLKAAIKLKTIGGYLFKDLELMSTTFEFELNIKELVDSIKKYEAPKSLLLQMGIKNVD